jgi:hypothetical protein
MYYFWWQTTPGRLSSEGRELTLYDEFGHVLEYSNGDGAIFTERYHRPEYTGRYFLTIRATDATGLGGYSFWAQPYKEFPQYRDVRCSGEPVGIKPGRARSRQRHRLRRSESHAQLHCGRHVLRARLQ